MPDLPSNIETGWTDERIALLKRRWAEGISASIIATELGDGISRSAVCGKAHRLKLPKRATLVSSALTNFSRAPARTRKPKSPASAAKGPKLHQPPFETAPLPEEELGNDVTHLIGIMDLTKDTCRWPHGDPLLAGFGFCGAQVQANSPYCPQHTKRGTRQP